MHTFWTTPLLPLRCSESQGIHHVLSQAPDSTKPYARQFKTLSHCNHGNAVAKGTWTVRYKTSENDSSARISLEGVSCELPCGLGHRGPYFALSAMWQIRCYRKKTWTDQHEIKCIRYKTCLPDDMHVMPVHLVYENKWHHEKYTRWWCQRGYSLIYVEGKTQRQRERGEGVVLRWNKTELLAAGDAGPLGVGWGLPCRKPDSFYKPIVSNHVLLGALSPQG